MRNFLDSMAVDEKVWFCELIIDWKDTEVRADENDLALRVVMVNLTIANLGLSWGCTARVSHHIWRRD